MKQGPESTLGAQSNSRKKNIEALLTAIALFTGGNSMPPAVASPHKQEIERVYMPHQPKNEVLEEELRIEMMLAVAHDKTMEQVQKIDKLTDEAYRLVRRFHNSKIKLLEHRLRVNREPSNKKRVKKIYSSKNVQPIDRNGMNAVRLHHAISLLERIEQLLEDDVTRKVPEEYLARLDAQTGASINHCVELMEEFLDEKRIPPAIRDMAIREVPLLRLKRKIYQEHQDQNSAPNLDRDGEKKTL